LIADGFSELGKDIISGDVEDGSIEDRSVLEDLPDVHLILEGIDLKLIEEGGLSSTNLVANPDNLFLSNDFNLSLNNLGLDLESLEERCLLGIKTSGTCGNSYLSGGNHTGLGGGRSGLGVKDVLDLGEVTIGEDDIGVQNKLVHDFWDVVILIPLILAVFIIFVFRIGFLHGSLEGGLHEGILTHDHMSVDGSELLSKHGDLLGGDVVGVNKESVLVFVSKLLEVSPDGLLLNSFGGLLDSGHFCLLDANFLLLE